MGCDFFYSGKLSDIKLQKKVIKLVGEYYSEDAIFIKPKPEQVHFTEYNLWHSLQYPEGLSRIQQYDYRMEHGTKRISHPFNYYGVIPLYGWELEEHGQFIFDRSAEGRLVRFLRLPDELGLPPRDDSYEKCEFSVVVHEGGYDRIIGGNNRFALLLWLIRLRWWPELHMGDDYNVCEYVGKVLQDTGLIKMVSDEAMDFQQCWDLFKVARDCRGDLNDLL